MVPFLVRVGIGGLFVVAGIMKIGHPADLAVAITAFRLGLPAPVVAAIALALPPFEILLGIYLIAGLLLPLSSVIAALVLALFTAIVASAVIRGLSAPCGCFGPADNQPASWLTVLRDASFLVPAVYLAWWSRARIIVSESSASG
ncbi:MAG: DoxX family membrane protein [Candidatus Eremiobacteraeota bacterium]|nr:DoxX family membrane protein [Candidatus Eremiobacteraeota bacterium]